MKKPFIVIDIETNTPDVSIARIIDICATYVAVSGPRLGSIDELCNPGLAVEDYITEITGISNKDLEAAEAFSVVGPVVRQFIGNLDVYAFNGPWLFEVLNREFANAGIPRIQKQKMHCVLEMIRKYRPIGPNSLSVLTREYNLFLDGRINPHRARGGAFLTLELIRTIRKMENEEKINV